MNIDEDLHGFAHGYVLLDYVHMRDGIRPPFQGNETFRQKKVTLEHLCTLLELPTDGGSRKSDLIRRLRLYVFSAEQRIQIHEFLDAERKKRSDHSNAVARRKRLEALLTTRPIEHVSHVALQFYEEDVAHGRALPLGIQY